MGTIRIYGRIGPTWLDDGVTDKKVRDQLEAMKPDETVELFINSGGGDVFHGAAIYNILRRHKGRVIAYVDGLAASAASLIAMAAHEVVMPENAWMMVHNPWLVAIGNADALRDTADLLDDLGASMLKSYKRKTGMSEDELKALLDGEAQRDGTWLDAARAVELGFADRVEEAEDAQALAQAFAHLDLAHLNNVPDQVAAVAKRGRAMINAALAAASHKGDDMAKDKQAQPGAESDAQTTTSATTPNNDVSAEELKRAGQEEERKRRKTLLALGSSVGLDRAKLDEIIDEGRPLEASKDLILEAVAAAQKAREGGREMHGSSGVRFNHGADERDKFRDEAVNAILMRSGRTELFDAKNRYRGHTLKELARVCVERTGQTPEIDSRDLIAQAYNQPFSPYASGGHTRSDFPIILRDVMHKELLRGYQEREETWQQWCRIGSLSDFREATRANLNLFDSLLEVGELGEYEYGTVGEQGERLQLGKYGRLYRFSWEKVINDELDAFTQMLAIMGRAAARVPGDLVYRILTDGQTMADGKPLFHADYNNLGDAVLDMDSLDAADAAMATQTKTVNGEDGEEEVTIDVEAKFLIVPRSLRGTAVRLNTSEFAPGGSGHEKNIVQGLHKVVVEARLDRKSKTAWHLADEGQIEVAFLDGQNQPQLDQVGEFDVDATKIKVRQVCTARALGREGLRKETGTAE